MPEACHQPHQCTASFSPTRADAIAASGNSVFVVESKRVDELKRRVTFFYFLSAPMSSRDTGILVMTYIVMAQETCGILVMAYIVMAQETCGILVMAYMVMAQETCGILDSRWLAF